MNKAELFFLEYLKSKYGIDLNMLDEYASSEEYEPNDMDIFYLVKMFNSIPEYEKELYENNALYKEVVDQYKRFEYQKAQLKSDKVVTAKTKKELHGKLKKALDEICKEKTDLLLEYMDSKLNITEEGHISGKVDSCISINYYKQTNILAMSGKEYALDEYCNSVFEYQCEFYKLSDNIDDSKMSVYESLATNSEWQNIISRLIYKTKPMEFTLSLNVLKPATILKAELDDFYKTANTIIEIASVFVNRLIYFHKSDAINDMDARAIYRTDPDMLFTKWQLYLDAYKLHESGHDYIEIFHILHGEDNKKTVANPYFTVKLYVDSARKLIKAAEQGTFPYVLDDEPSPELSK